LDTSDFVYILASKKNGTLYVGVTSDLVKRVFEHKQNMIEGFTKKYGVHTLVLLQTKSDKSLSELNYYRLKPVGLGCKNRNVMVG